MGEAKTLQFSGARSLGSGEGHFSTRLKDASLSDADAWVWLAYDQLHVSMLSSLPLDGTVGAVFIESSWKAKRRPYHQQKLGVLLSNQRHFALELQDSGVPVIYLSSIESYSDVLAAVCQDAGPVHCINAAERELREEVAPLVDDGRLIVHEHPGWLTPRS